MAWEPSKSEYTTGEKYRLGKWLIGGYHYGSAQPRGEKPFYTVTCSLPGIKSEVGRCETQEAARALFEKAVKHWLDGAQLETKETS